MIRKGSVEFAALAVFSMFIVISAIGFTFEYQDVVERKFRHETTQLVAERVAGDIQALSAYKGRGQIEINLAADKYHFQAKEFEPSSETNSDYVYRINMTFEERSPGYANVSLNGRLETDPGEGRYICLTKNSGTINAGSGEC